MNIPDTNNDVLEHALDKALARITRNGAAWGQRFPDDVTLRGEYQPRPYPGLEDGANTGWTTGFWTGLLWMAYECSQDVLMREAALAHLPSYAERLAEHIDIGHHDMGFLYTPSCVAAHRIVGDAQARQIALDAAATLMSRYLPAAGIIQAWGDLDDPAQGGRMIIDCLLNLPLLHWAAQEGGEPRYRAAALSHLEKSRDYLVRADSSSFHTYHFDPHSGVPLRGSSHQGAGTDSCWARGQAWGMYGFAINHRYAPELGLLDVAVRQAEYFLARLPANGVAYWDLIYGEGSGEPWDSSASAIAACGLLEIAGLTKDVALAQRYNQAALSICQGLIEHCTADAGDALLLHGVYSKPEERAVDEGNLWGDFFFLETLLRLTGRWRHYW